MKSSTGAQLARSPRQARRPSELGDGARSLIVYAPLYGRLAVPLVLASATAHDSPVQAQLSCKISSRVNKRTLETHARAGGES